MITGQDNCTKYLSYVTNPKLSSEPKIETANKEDNYEEIRYETLC